MFWATVSPTSKIFAKWVLISFICKLNQTLIPFFDGAIFFLNLAVYSVDQLWFAAFDVVQAVADYN